MGDIQVGDVLLDQRGHECNVTFISDIRELDCYRISFSNGETVVCDGDHRWLTTARITRPGMGYDNSPCAKTAVRDTREIYRTHRAGKRGDANHSLAMPAPMQGRAAELALDPYILGAWLGDGSRECPEIWCSRYDAPFMAAQIESAGLKVTTRVERTAHSLYMQTPGANRRSESNLARVMRRVGVLDNKHIPHVYLRASFDQRLALLQGLMDTDGHISKCGGVLEFCSASRKLAIGFEELLATFGIKYRTRMKRNRCNGRDVDGESSYIQFFVSRDTLPVFRMPRKLARMRSAACCKVSPRSRTVQIVSVERVATVPTKCIRVDSPDHLFLFGRTMLPTHNTPLMAALVLCFLCGPEARRNSEIVSASTDRDSASHIFKYAKQMIELDDELKDLCQCFDSTRRIIYLPLGTAYRALAADAKRNHGGVPVFGIYDELAQAPNRDLYDVIETSFGAADEGLFVVISTQSSDPTSIMTELADEALACMRGELDDDTFFGEVLAVPEPKPQGKKGEVIEQDPQSDIFNEANWILANPALGDFKSLEHMRMVAAKAKRSPAAETAFRRLELNQRVDGTSRLVNSADWRACEGDVDEHELANAPCWGGLDLSSKLDLTAFSLVWSLSHNRVATKTWFWTHEHDLEDRAKKDGALYPIWRDQEWLTVTPGRTVQYNFVVQDIARILARYDLQAIGFDRWKITELKKEMEWAGISEATFKLLEYGQGYKDQTPAIDQIEEHVVNHTLVHDGNPVLTYCLKNVKVIGDHAGNRKFDKRKRALRIDGAVTLGMALSLRSRDAKPEATGPSVYESAGFVM
jgi:phage terminase large subunit-like protein